MLLGAQMVRVAVQLLALVMLARLLPPQAFGLLAMVGAVSIVLDLVKDFGLSTATIQRQEIGHAQVSALFWINVGLGAGMAGLLFVAAPLLASFYGQPELTDVARWMCLGFLASSLTVQHWALLRRQMRFGAIAGIETGAEIAGAALAIAAAASGAGYWALVLQRIASPVLSMAASWWICGWRPAAPRPSIFRAGGLRHLLAFGAGVMGGGLAAAFSRSIDQILVGWLWGASVLGLYERTTRLLMLPVNTINAPVYAAAMPALSRLVDDATRYRALFGQMIQKLALLTMPAFGLCAMVADWVVIVLLGEAWLEAVPLVMLFSLAALALPVQMAAGILYMTHARGGELLRASLVDAAIVLAAILVGLRWGVVGIAASLASVGLVIRAPVAFWLATRGQPVAMGDIWRAIAPPATASLAIMAAVWSLRQLVRSPDGPSLGAIAAATATAIATLIVVLLAWPDTRREALVLSRRVGGLLPTARGR